MKKILRWFKNLFRNLESLAKKFVQPSILIVEGIKNFVESPASPLLTAIIPGTLDDVIIIKAKKYLPKILISLKISEECLKLEATDEIIFCAIKALKNYEPDARAATYHSIAAMLATYLSDGKLTWSEAIHLAEYFYKNK